MALTPCLGIFHRQMGLESRDYGRALWEFRCITLASFYATRLTRDFNSASFHTRVELV